MAKHIIPTYEQDGMNVRIFCLLIDAEDGMTPDDILEAIKKACVEYCSTPEGRKVYEDNCNHFNYGDFNAYVPNSICKKYGISKTDPKYNCFGPVCFGPVCFDEQLVDDVDIDDDIW